MMFEIRCPDGCVRHFPYHNGGDVTHDAHLVNTEGCWCLAGRYGAPNDLEKKLPRCEGGVHVVRKVQ